MGASSTRRSHRADRKPQVHSRKNRKRASHSDDRGLRYFELRIAHAGTLLFMYTACSLVPIRVHRRVHDTDQSPVSFFIFAPTWQFLSLATSASVHPNSLFIETQPPLQVDRETLRHSWLISRQLKLSFEEKMSTAVE